MLTNLPSVTLGAPRDAVDTLPRQDSQALIENAGDTFAKLFDNVNQLQHTADRKVEEFATSKEKDVHGTMIALQKADLSLRLLLQIRSKLTAAYQEIMRIQV